MTKKITVSLPDDVAERLAEEPNASAFVADAVRRRMGAEQMRRALQNLGFNITDEGLAEARREYDELMAKITPELRQEAAELAARVRSGRRW
jgi:hypothetical protein